MWPTALPHLPADWQSALQTVCTQPSFMTLLHSVAEAYMKQTIYPTPTNLWRAFTLTPVTSVRVVLLGQDPYHGPGQANGLAFSVPDDVPIPPSLRTIYQEIMTDIGTPPPQSGDLSRLATQGVLLLNSSLTVQAGVAGSHRHLGWEPFTDQVIRTISDIRPAVVFLLWGKSAQAKHALIDTTKHLVLSTSHPSPLSAYRGFIGCQHFSQANTYLKHKQLPPIKW